MERSIFKMQRDDDPFAVCYSAVNMIEFRLLARFTSVFDGVVPALLSRALKVNVETFGLLRVIVNVTRTNFPQFNTPGVELCMGS